MRQLWAVAVTCALVAADHARADFAATYSLAGRPGDEAAVAPDAATVPPGVLLSDLTRGPGLTAAVGADSINSRGWTTATAPDPDDYYQFVVTPGAAPLSLSGLEFSGQRSLADGPTGVEVRFSLDNFATSTLIALFALSPASDANFRAIIDLASYPTFQHLTAAATFRIFASGAASASGTFRLGIDANAPASNLPANLVLNGTVVPEPASLLLVALGGIPLLAVGARRRRAA